MHVAAVLKRKGSNVVTIHPERTISDVAHLLTANRIGAVVVAEQDRHVLGIISERDIIHGIARHGHGVLDMPVTELMTREVLTCDPRDTMARIMAVMTDRRVRHLPVCEDGRLIGMISIGDVVKQRLNEAEVEVESLRDYVGGKV